MRIFQPGEVIDRREVLHELPWLVVPVRVIHDSGDVVAVYLREGTPLIFPDHPFGPHPWCSRDRWTATSVLHLHRPGDAHAIWGFYEAGMFTGWYVNFQAPARRWSHGFDTHDHGVDIWLPGGGPDWQWKDRDHVDELVQVGRLTAEEASHVWAETERVSSALDRGDRWWSDWDSWQPDPGLETPSVEASTARLSRAKP